MANDAAGPSDTSTTTETTPPLPEPPKLLGRGMAAMQGEETSTNKENDLHTGRMAEIATLEKIRTEEGRGIDLNSVREGGNSNFPIYDVAGSETIASVKHFGQEDGAQLSEATLTNYRKALREAIGNGSDPQKFEKAAKGLSELSETGKPVPIGLRDNPLEYLRNHAQLWIPEDHAYQVKEDLSHRFHSTDLVTREATASQYNLNPESETYNQDVADFLNRIKAIPKTSSELKKEFTTHTL